MTSSKELEQRLLAEWNEVHEFTKRDIGNSWHRKKSIKRFRKDLEKLEAEFLVELANVKKSKIGGTALKSKEIVAASRKLVELLNHVVSNKRWRNSVSALMRIIIDDLEDRHKKYTEAEQLVIEALKHYNIGELQDLTFITGGFINYNIQITTLYKKRKKKFYFRAYQYHQDDEHIILEHQLLEFLVKKQFVAIGPVKTKDGKTFTRIGDEFISIFPWQVDITLDSV